MEKTIEVGAILPCPDCRELILFHDEICERDLPAELTCGYCGGTTVLKSIPPLPKAIGKITAGSWKISWLGDKPEQSEPVQQDQTASPEVQFQSFNDQSKAIGENLKTGLRLIEKLNKDLFTLADVMQQNFTVENQISNTIGREWDAGRILQFIRNPICSVPAECDDETAAFYSRYVMFPTFIDLRIGVPISENQGYRIELVNSYSQIGKPLLEWVRQQIDVPKPLELEVLGNKIIGPSLFKVWQEIPGTVEDDDHTDTMPSIKMHNQRQARCWLVKHGIASWQSSPIDLHTIGITAIYEELERDIYLSSAWNMMRNHGRMFLAWENYKQAIEFCLIFCHQMNGRTLVISGDSYASKKWNDIFQGRTHANKYRFIHGGYEDFHDINKLEAVTSIIVDYRSGVPIDFLAKMFNYRGKLIVLHDDPFLDCLGMNEEAALIYGLCGRGMFRMAASDNKTPRRSLPEGSRLKESLFALQRIVPSGISLAVSSGNVSVKQESKDAERRT